MTIRNLNSIFSPSSVALVSTDSSLGNMSNVLADNLFSGGFKGKIFFVQPQYATFDGMATYRDIADLPQTPDLAIIATAPETVPKLIVELGQRGTRGAVVITGGFNDNTPADSRKMHAAMLASAKPYLLRIVGPDCCGVMVPGLGLNAGMSPITPLAGNLAFVAQSGAILNVVLDWATPRGIGFSHCVSLGDMVDVDFGDMIDYLTNEYSTRAILLYIESITSVRKFMSAARAAARIKPVIVVKAGHYAKNAKNSKAEKSFTADALYDAAFRRAGILRVKDMQALFDAVQTLAIARQVSGNRLAILSNSGSLALMASDTLIEREGRLAELSPETLGCLGNILPSGVAHGNPVQINADAPGSYYSDALVALLKDKEVDAVLVLNYPTAGASSTEVAEAVINTVQKTTSIYNQKVVLTCWMGESSALEARRLFAENHIATYATPTEAVRGFMQLVRHKKSQEMLLETPANIPEIFTPDSTKAQQVIDKALADNRHWLTESEAQAVLTAYTIQVAKTYEASSPKAAHELIIDMSDDDLFGPVIRVGHGGNAVEVIGDSAFALPPLNMHLAHEVLARTQIYRFLQGYPGMKGANIESIALMLVKVSQLVCDIADIAELEINPLLADEHGVTVLDARIRVVKATCTAIDRLAIPPYPKHLEEILVLPDGQSLLIRPIRPEDEPNFQKIFADLSPEDIRMRFLHPMKTMPHSLAARLTQIDYDREMSLVVEGKDRDGIAELYGIVQISADPDIERAEFAILLRRDMTGLGLGPMLLRRIIDYASSRGISEIFGEVLSENKPMLKLCRVFGFEITADREDPGTKQVSLRL